jgi:hypothetical protein
VPNLVTALVTASQFIGARSRGFLTGTSLHCWMGSLTCFMPKAPLTFGRVSALLENSPPNKTTQNLKITPAPKPAF